MQHAVLDWSPHRDVEGAGVGVAAEIARDAGDWSSADRKRGAAGWHADEDVVGGGGDVVIHDSIDAVGGSHGDIGAIQHRWSEVVMREDLLRDDAALVVASFGGDDDVSVV